MFEEGTIIYFDPFYFKNGGKAKSKYFLVLKNDSNCHILASLPTRSDHIPEKDTIDRGCVELPASNLNCFVISNQECVTECKKHFSFKTHLYGHLIDNYEVNRLQEIYPIENSDYSIFGKMESNLFQEIIDCFKNSKSVKRKYKKLL